MNCFECPECFGKFFYHTTLNDAEIKESGVGVCDGKEVKERKCDEMNESYYGAMAEVGFCHENCYYHNTDGEYFKVFCCNLKETNDLPEHFVDKIIHLEVRCPFWCGYYDYCKKHDVIYPKRKHCDLCFDENLANEGVKVENDGRRYI